MSLIDYLLPEPNIGYCCVKIMPKMCIRDRHPADITEENLDELKAAGVTMVSLGIQSFNRDCLSKLGRVGEGYARKLRTLGKAGFDVVDVDLIFAIPGQTEEMLIDDVDTAFSLGATQVSTYPFIDFTFADNDYRPLPAKEKKRMLQALVVHCLSLIHI